MRNDGRAALAATVHDPGEDFLAALRRTGPMLRDLFSGFGVLATEPTAPGVVRFLEGELGAVVGRAPADGNVGRHRRESVRLAGEATAVMYSDLDHVLRWIETDRREVESVLAESDTDVLVVGRTGQAMAACPQRLRDTETIVNHIYELATGRSWDLMFAIRLLSPAAARLIVDQGSENSIANDIEWPMLAETAGLTLAYREAGALSYRIREEFEDDQDGRDGDPLRWIQRVEIANLHAAVLKRFIDTAAGRAHSRLP